jgi:subtilisin family serine protease
LSRNGCQRSSSIRLARKKERKNREDTHQLPHQLLEDTHQIAAVNMSLGGGRFFDQSSCDAANGAVKDAIEQLRSIDIATVMASGNDGWKDSVASPACISTGISVGNTSDNDAVAPSSNISPQIHLLAPGTSITSSVPGEGTAVFTGTSMSAPHVAGAWAVLKQANPAASVDEILAHLQSSATLVDDQRQGGIETAMKRINLDAALDRSGTVFAVLNRGPAMLTVTSIGPESPAPWISVNPAGPFELAAGELQLVQVLVDYENAPTGTSRTRLLLHSNDPHKSPWPDGVFIHIETFVLDIIHADGFEQDLPGRE